MNDSVLLSGWFPSTCSHHVATGVRMCADKPGRMLEMLLQLFRAAVFGSDHFPKIWRDTVLLAVDPAPCKALVCQ